MDDVSRESEIRGFLMRRREGLRVEDVHLEDWAPERRRVTGLRREEVARLAGVSSDYYTRLEQGRVQPSEPVLGAVARALRLSEAERAYLFELVRPQRALSAEPPAIDTQSVRPGLRQILETWRDQPALIVGNRTEVLATNRMARALLTDFAAMARDQRNLLRWLLLDEHARHLYLDWADVASDMVARLRPEVASRPDDAKLTELVGELAVKSPEFRGWWADHHVLRHSHGRKRFDHPLVGRMDLQLEVFTLPDDPGQTLFVYSADPGSRSHEALELLADHVDRDARR